MVQHFELDPDGDLTLVVGDVADVAEATTNQSVNSDNKDEKADGKTEMKGCTILVSRRHVAMASPVFKAMLGPRWKEADVDRIPLPEDDPSALLLLLRIAHIQFDAVSRKIDRSLLFRVAVLCDKYDCFRLTKPWLKGWAMKHNFFGAYQTGDAFISWTFGFEKVFEHTLVSLVQQSMLAIDTSVHHENENIWKIIYNGQFLEDELLPPGYMERVQELRTWGLDEIIQILSQAADKYSSDDSRVCIQNADDKFCDAAVYGSLHRKLGPYLEAGRRHPKNLAFSLYDIRNAVAVMDIAIWPSDSRKTAITHSSCNPQPVLKQQCDNVIAQLGNGVTNAQRAHLRRQASACGSTSWQPTGAPPMFGQLRKQPTKLFGR